MILTGKTNYPKFDMAFKTGTGIPSCVIKLTYVDLFGLFVANPGCCSQEYGLIDDITPTKAPALVSLNSAAGWSS